MAIDVPAILPELVLAGTALLVLVVDLFVERVEDYRAVVRKEFDGLKALFGEYQAALKKVYTVPNVPEPK